MDRGRCIRHLSGAVGAWTAGVIEIRTIISNTPSAISRAPSAISLAWGGGGVPECRIGGKRARVPPWTGEGRGGRGGFPECRTGYLRLQAADKILLRDGS